MQHEWARFATFENYPSEHPCAISFSKNGFYYIGISTTVRCFACDFEINDLPDGSLIKDIHIHGSPQCPFATDESSQVLNVPIHSLGDRRPEPQTTANVPENSGGDRRQPSRENTGAKKTELGSNSAENSMEMDAVQTDGSGARGSAVSTSGQQNESSARELSSRTGFHAADRLETNINKVKKALQNENEDLRRQVSCKVCLDLDACVVFLPCGHMVTCEECAPAMRKCPICRSDIRGT
ncbi:PIAP-like protein, partial [Mya arenaria]